MKGKEVEGQQQTTNLKDQTIDMTDHDRIGKPNAKYLSLIQFHPSVHRNPSSSKHNQRQVPFQYARQIIGLLQSSPQYRFAITETCRGLEDPLTSNDLCNCRQNKG